MYLYSYSATECISKKHLGISLISEVAEVHNTSRPAWIDISAVLHSIQLYIFFFLNFGISVKPVNNNTSVTRMRVTEQQTEQNITVHLTVNSWAVWNQFGVGYRILLL